jgi:hypothetical protein
MVLEHALGHAVTKALLRWVSGNRRPDADPAPTGVGWELAYGLHYKALWTGMALASSGFVVLVLAAEILEDDFRGLLRIAAYAVFGGLSVYSWLWCVRSHLYRVRLYEWGFEVVLPGRQRSSVPWSELTGVSASRRFDTVSLHRTGKPPVKIMMELGGLEHLRRELERVQGAIDPAIAERMTRPELTSKY